MDEVFQDFTKEVNKELPRGLHLLWDQTHNGLVVLFVDQNIAIFIQLRLLSKMGEGICFLLISILQLVQNFSKH